MGCCFSTPKSPKQDPNDQNGSNIQQSHLRSPEQKLNATHEIDNRAPPPPPPPPPPPVEEETVKEVLSETPLSKPQVSILVEERKTQMAVIEPQVEKFEAKPKGVVEKVEEVSEVSQISEICSISESFSTTTNPTTATTTPIAEKREDEAISKRLNRPPSNNVPRKRPCTMDSTGGGERRPKSPARGPEPSPEKKKKIHGITRSVRGRESGQVATRKLNVGPARVRRDPGEGSGRRSKSPSARPVSAGGRSQAKAVENGGSEKVGEKNDDVPLNPQESLDNPHVSLECFIFL